MCVNGYKYNQSCYDVIITAYLVPAVVDLPTPPLPEATTTMCLTPAIGHLLGRLLRIASVPSEETYRLKWCNTLEDFAMLDVMTLESNTNGTGMENERTQSCVGNLEINIKKICLKQLS